MTCCSPSNLPNSSTHLSRTEQFRSRADSESRACVSMSLLIQSFARTPETEQSAAYNFSVADQREEMSSFIQSRQLFAVNFGHYCVSAFHDESTP
jgi:hypothetical protein